MKELERYKKAIEAARVNLMSLDQNYNMILAGETLDIINAILNPSPAAEEVEVVAYKCTSCGAYYDDGELLFSDQSTADCTNCGKVGFIAKLKGRITRPVPQEETYTLELSKAEAETLRRVTMKVAGDPFRSRRKYVDAIAYKLRRMGVEDPGQHLTQRTEGIIFYDEAGLE